MTQNKKLKRFFTFAILCDNTTHHPGIRLRNKLVPWNLHVSMAGLLASDSRFTPLTYDQMIP
jgi:hypothetical protein